jgi:hypothetical protein
VPYIRLGKKRDICGKIKKKIRQTAIAIKNGIIPLNMVHTGTSGTAPPTAKTTRPTGGLICPINTVTTVNTPTQTGSKPKELVRGNVSGSRISNMDMISRNSPSIIYKISIAIRTTQPLTESEEIICTREKGTVLSASMDLKILAPIISIRIIQVVLTVLYIAFINLFQVKRLAAKPKIKVANAPIAPASVGVKKPA